MRVAAATPSRPALAAALAVAGAGGGAVDAAIAAAAVAMVTEVGVCAPGAGGFLTVSHGGESATYDGYMSVPGLGNRSGPRPQVTEVTMAYGGGITTVVGPGSIATPGVWAAMEEAHRRHGRIEWRALLAPASALARNGFGFGPASLTYLRHSHHLVYGHDPASASAIHHPDGTLRGVGELISMPDLADSLEELSREGSAAIHRGDLGRRIADDLRERGAILAWDDLLDYRAEPRTPLVHRVGSWVIATNPAPAIGGEAVVAVLERLEELGTSAQAHVAAQGEVFSRRLRGDPLRSPSTIQISVVDEAGTACALTASSGYGSGVIPSGTGMWMNNALGELELMGDAAALVPGERLVSNMAPTVGTADDGSVLAIGSPGAARITSALAQVIGSIALDRLPFGSAVARPRLHVEVGDQWSVSCEPGVELADGPLPVERFDTPHMYFGGVGAALRMPDGSLEAFADPRRDGAAGVS
ncbi:MAG: gamma-glutamyltransferase [Acidimicrobiia bacterium]